MAKAKLYTNTKETPPVDYLLYECPVCGTHSVPVTGPKKWGFNGDLEKPTITPSVLHFHTRPDGSRQTHCHYFVRDGKIQYCGDSPHKLSGQTVDLPDWNEPPETKD